MSRSLGGRWVTSRSPMKILPLVDLLEAGEHPQARGLAAAGGPDEDHELAVVDLEVEVVHRGALGPGIPALRLLEADCCHADRFPSPAGTCRTIRSKGVCVRAHTTQIAAVNATRPPCGHGTRRSGRRRCSSRARRARRPRRRRRRTGVSCASRLASELGVWAITSWPSSSRHCTRENGPRNATETTRALGSAVSAE